MFCSTGYTVPLTPQSQVILFRQICTRMYIYASTHTRTPHVHFIAFIFHTKTNLISNGKDSHFGVELTFAIQQQILLDINMQTTMGGGGILVKLQQLTGISPMNNNGNRCGLWCLVASSIEIDFDID